MLIISVCRSLMSIRNDQAVVLSCEVNNGMTGNNRIRQFISVIQFNCIKDSVKRFDKYHYICVYINETMKYFVNHDKSG